MTYKTVTIYATNGYEGTVSPTDAHPPFSLTFSKGVAVVPLSTFNLGSFQAYFARQEMLGRWTREAPVQAAVEIIPPAPKPKPKPKPKAKAPSVSATARPKTAAVGTKDPRR